MANLFNQVMGQRQPTVQHAAYAPTVYYQMSTSNKSFLDMHYYLKSIGIKNNKFFLALLDKDLAGVDPHDPTLNQVMKQKVLRECMANYWYFLREVVRIPDQGATGGGVKYALHRGNLALNFIVMLNLNVFLELPRQHFKTISVVCRYLYLYNFGTSNSEMTLLHKKFTDSKLNLQRLKELRDCLPSYLRMNQPYSQNGKKIKVKDTVEQLFHPLNGNRICTVPSATSEVTASNLLRGRTIPLLWADEWAFVKYNKIVYLNAVPALKTASMNAARNHAPYGIIITTTPGHLTDDEGVFAYEMKDGATEFNEVWYDLSYKQIKDIVDANDRSNFVYIRFTYQQLGRSEQWFKEICKEMQFEWADIRREVLLEWSLGTSNSPFTQEDLESVARLVKEPKKVVYFLGKYIFNIYEDIELVHGIPKYPPLIGVDVSGGYNRDSSAICCVNSFTTKVFADLKCNYISTPELARVIYELVSNYMPNAVVNVERNGGFGASVLAKLVTSPIKRNLYYEYKDKVIEEQHDGTRVIRKTQKMKVYGLDSTKAKRELLIQILRERMDNHKDKFVSKRIYDELVGMEVKKSGKVEHSSNTHDDLVFSYLMAMYMWYEGRDLRERFGIVKTSIKTDEDIDEVAYGLEEKYSDIITEITDANPVVDEKDYNVDLKEFLKGQGKSYQQFLQEQQQKDNAALGKVIRDMIMAENSRRKYTRLHGLKNEPTEDLINVGFDAVMPPEVFNMGTTEDIDMFDPNKNPNNVLPSNWNELDNY